MLCPLCKHERPTLTPVCDVNTDIVVIQGECEICGRVRITSQAISTLSEDDTSRLSAYFRQSTSRPDLVDAENLKTLLRVLPNYTALEKFNLLLDVVARKTRRIGGPTTFSPRTDYPLIFSKDGQEAEYMMQTLMNKGFLFVRDGYALTHTGWEQLEVLRTSSRRSARAFVAMWFDKSREAFYSSAIEPAIKKAGYEALHVGKRDHTNNINDEIIGGMRTSRFMVADFTGQRGGVYFESGFMQGMGRNVFWVCEDGSRDQLHFDVDHFLFTFYKNEEDLKEKLFRRIVAIEGPGPHYSDN